MANQSHLYQGIYSGDHIPEGVAELLYQLDPEDFPLLSLLPTRPCSHPKFEWLVRARGARQGTSGTHRAVPPGDPFLDQTTYPVAGTSTDIWENLATPSRVFNYCEIFRVLPRIDETALATDFYGIRDLIADQLEFRATDFMIHIEERLWNGTKNAGPTGAGDTTAWQLGGLASEVSTNSFDLGSDSIKDVDMLNIFNACWDNGGKPQDWWSGPRVKSSMQQGLGSNMTKYVDQNDRGVIQTLDYYEAGLQTVRFHLTRDLEDGAATATGTTAIENRALLLDHSQLMVVYQREPFMQRLPQVAGDVRFRIEAQLTLGFGDESGHAEAVDMALAAGLTVAA